MRGETYAKARYEHDALALVNRAMVEWGFGVGVVQLEFCRHD
jgi:hypothetical protein